MSDEGEPKLIIDSDWKNEAQAEKERLAAEAEASAAAGHGAGAPGQLPPADFRTLLGMLATQALMYLGGMPDAEGRAMFDPEAGKHMIDLLGVLEEKTKGNLSDEEAQEISGVITELQNRFVQLAQAIAAQGGAPGAGDAGAAPGPDLRMPNA